MSTCKAKKTAKITKSKVEIENNKFCTHILQLCWSNISLMCKNNKLQAKLIALVAVVIKSRCCVNCSVFISYWSFITKVNSRYRQHIDTFRELSGKRIPGISLFFCFLFRNSDKQNFKQLPDEEQAFFSSFRANNKTQPVKS